MTQPNLSPQPTPEKILLAILVGGIALGCGYVIHPFLPAILWAAILVLSTWPVFEWLTTRAKLPRVAAALLMVLAAALLLIVPIALSAPGGAQDIAALRHAVENWATQIPPAPGILADIPLIGAPLTDTWNHWAADISSMTSFFSPYMGMAAERGLSLLLSLAGGAVQLIVALLVAFVFWLSGEALGDAGSRLILRIGGPDIGKILLTATVRTVRGTVYGILGTAIIQGFLTAFGLAIADVPRAVLLGTIAAFLAILPIGAPVVWIPAALWLFSSGQTGHGIFLLVYGTVIVSGADHAIRPWLISRGARMPFLLILLGILGGALAFGAVGIIIGPVLLSLGYALLLEFIPAPVARES